MPADDFDLSAEERLELQQVANRCGVAYLVLCRIYCLGRARGRLAGALAVVPRPLALERGAY